MITVKVNDHAKKISQIFVVKETPESVILLVDLNNIAKRECVDGEMGSDSPKSVVVCMGTTTIEIGNLPFYRPLTFCETSKSTLHICVYSRDLLDEEPRRIYSS